MEKLIPDDARSRGGWPSYVAEIARLNNVVDRLNAELDCLRVRLAAKESASTHNKVANIAAGLVEQLDDENVRLRAELDEARSLLAEGREIVLGLTEDRWRLRREVRAMAFSYIMRRHDRWFSVRNPDGGTTECNSEAEALDIFRRNCGLAPMPEEVDIAVEKPEGER